MAVSEDTQHNTTKGFLYAAGGLTLVSTNFVTVKYGLRGFSPGIFSIIWICSAAMYSLLIVLCTGRAKSLLIPRREMLKVIVVGLMGGTAILFAWVGLNLLDPSFAAFLWRCSPVVAIVLGAVFLHERLTVWELVPAALMLGGGVLSTLGRWNLVGAGVIATLIASVAVAVQMVVAKSGTRNVDPVVMVFYRNGIGALLLVALVTATGWGEVNAGPSHWGVLMLGAFLGPCLSFVLTFRSFKYWEMSKTSIVRMVQPLLVIPMAYGFLGQFPTGRELIGGLLIMAGAFGFVLVHARSGKKVKPAS